MRTTASMQSGPAANAGYNRPVADPALGESGIAAAHGPGADARAPVRILFVVRSLRGYLRFFEQVMELMVERGHRLHLLLETVEDEGTRERRWLAAMEAHEGFTWEVRGVLRDDRWFKPAKAVREAVDYVRVLDPMFDERQYFRRRGEGRSPAFVRSVFRTRAMRRPAVLRAAERILVAIDTAMPVGRGVRCYLAGLAPDVLVISPYLPPGSLHSTYVKQAGLLGIPTALCVASWDNLSSKQLIRGAPTRVVVWNETQREEAVAIHGLPGERVAVTGAQVFDAWFEWTPRPRAAFCAEAGLDPERPYLLYVAGALNPGRITEAEWVDEWLRRLRAADDPALRRLQVMVRPHPKRNPDWERVRPDDHEDVVVFPKGRLKMPLDADLRNDYFDSIHHSSAVVGLNSTAMIEAAIAGKPVLTVLADDFYDSQLGTFHFEYLMNVAGGVVQAAETFEEHHAQLAAALAGDGAAAAERARRFVGDFVRPHGLDRPATPAVVDEIEAVARAGEAALDEPAWVPALRAAIVVAVYLRHPEQAWRGLSLRLGRLRSRR